MNDDAKLKNEAARGMRAQEALDNPELKRALIEIEGNLLIALKSTKFFQAKKREDIYRRLQLLDDLQRQLRKVVNGGAMARHEIGLAQRLKNVVNL